MTWLIAGLLAVIIVGGVVLLAVVAVFHDPDYKP